MGGQVRKEVRVRGDSSGDPGREAGRQFLRSGLTNLSGPPPVALRSTKRIVGNGRSRKGLWEAVLGRRACHGSAGSAENSSDRKQNGSCAPELPAGKSRRRFGSHNREAFCWSSFSTAILLVFANRDNIKDWMVFTMAAFPAALQRFELFAAYQYYSFTFFALGPTSSIANSSTQFFNMVLKETVLPFWTGCDRLCLWGWCSHGDES